MASAAAIPNAPFFIDAPRLRSRCAAGAKPRNHPDAERPSWPTSAIGLRLADVTKWLHLQLRENRPLSRAPTARRSPMSLGLHSDDTLETWLVAVARDM